MKHLKKILVLGITGAMLTTPVNAFAASIPVNDKAPFDIVSPRFAYDYEETITRTYSSKADIKETYYYEYFSNDWNCWFRGTLKLQSTTQKGKKFIATYTGTMYGSPT